MVRSNTSGTARVLARPEQTWSELAGSTGGPGWGLGRRSGLDPREPRVEVWRVRLPGGREVGRVAQLVVPDGVEPALAVDVLRAGSVLGRYAGELPPPVAGGAGEHQRLAGVRREDHLDVVRPGTGAPESGFAPRLANHVAL